MARRAKGEGAIVQLGPKKFLGRIRRAGQPTIHVSGKSRAEVADKLHQARLRGASAPKTPVTVGEFLEQHVARVERQRRTSTGQRYRYLVSAYCGSVAKTKLQKLDTPAVRALLDRVERDHGSHAALSVFRLLRAALRRGERERMVTRSPMIPIDPPARVSAKIEAWTIARVKVFLEAIRGDRLEALYAMAVTLGPRPSELFGLRWGDIDFEAGVIRIERQLVELMDGTLEVAPPKTERGRRKLPMIPIVRAALLAMPRGEAAAYVFTTVTGKPMRISNFRTREWHPLLKRIGFPKVRFYVSRHTAATMARAAGGDLLAVSWLLGHANTQITAAVYVDLFQDELAELGGAVDALLSNEPPA